MRTTSKVGALAALALAQLSLQAPALAGPDEQVYMPTVEQGEREIELKLGTAKLRDGSRFNAQTLSAGWGVNAGWFTELAAKWHQEPGDRHRFDAWEWENRFQLTETGKYPVDLGLLLEIERPQDRNEGYEVRWGPLLQAELGTRVQANLNLLFEKHYRSSEPSPAELGYQWQLKWRWQPALELGAQGLGNFGPWKHWAAHDQQTHVAGPAVFGRMNFAPRQTVKYSAALLLGMNQASPRSQWRMAAEYEF
jgi:hypothetical protein